MPKISGCFGTGFLIGPRHIVTAYHVIMGEDTPNNPQKIACVFDYIDSDYSQIDNVKTFDKSSVYYIVEYEQLGKKDIAVCLLDRCVKDGSDENRFRDLSENNWYEHSDLSDNIKSENLMTWSHQKGMPMVFAYNGKAEQVFYSSGTRNKDTLFSTLDVCHGSSGAPIYVQNGSHASFGRPVAVLVGIKKFVESILPEKSKDNDFVLEPPDYCIADRTTLTADGGGYGRIIIVSLKGLRDLNIIKTQQDCPSISKMIPPAHYITPVKPPISRMVSVKVPPRVYAYKVTDLSVVSSDYHDAIPIMEGEAYIWVWPSSKVWFFGTNGEVRGSVIVN
jgi:V8-like Glu-specific endopeptidase